MDLPAGTRNYSYAQDMSIFRTRTHWALLIALLIILFTAPFYLGNYWLGVANLIGITIIAATGLNILTGYCGQLSIGHAGFIAVGAYTSAVLTNRLELPFIVGLICAGLVAGLVGMLFGIPSLKVKGFYLAISTIAAQFIIIWIINHWSSVTGGFVGITVPYASIGGLVFKSEGSQFFLIMSITALSIFFAKNLARTRVGRAFVAIRDNDIAAEAIGINIFYYKLVAFAICTFFAGIAGALMNHYLQWVHAESFTLLDSVWLIGMVIVGGMGSTVGAIFGVVFLMVLRQLMLIFGAMLEGTGILIMGGGSGILQIAFGLVILLFLIFEPRGLAHRWNVFKGQYRLWPFAY